MGESSDDSIQELEGLDESWYVEVEPAFEKHGLSCTLNEDICRMTVFETEYTGDPDMILKGRLALIVLAAGLTTEWVERILSGRVHCDVIRIPIPDGMFRQEFISKYDEFISKFDDIFELHKKWSCLVLYLETSVVVLANTFEDTSRVRCLVQESLLGNIPFEDHVLVK
ncbi:hypothetical protein M0R45_024405 [Rubus argutus]|uniref:Uncharacterized protein n=1 Tax=Rubus argutus TaxID=59490 RepID=A0AAW1WU29_RUBAR